MSSPVLSRMTWYVEHRLEFLRNRKENLKDAMANDSDGKFDFEALREFLEIKGRIRELENLLGHADSW